MATSTSVTARKPRKVPVPSPAALEPGEFPNAPRDGEPLDAYVNRVRPRGAPRVSGCPIWRDQYTDWSWHVEGWSVVLTYEHVDLRVEWSQDDFPEMWYALTTYGERRRETHDDPWEFAEVNHG